MKALVFALLILFTSNSYASITCSDTFHPFAMSFLRLTNQLKPLYLKNSSLKSQAYDHLLGEFTKEERIKGHLIDFFHEVLNSENPIHSQIKKYLAEDYEKFFTQNANPIYKVDELGSTSEVLHNPIRLEIENPTARELINNRIKNLVRETQYQYRISRMATNPIGLAPHYQTLYLSIMLKVETSTRGKIDVYFVKDSLEFIIP